MGFYDCRCAVTGISLKGADTALVLLQQVADGYAPIALAVKGNNNRYGSIDMLDEDENTALVFGFFQRALRSGDLVVDEEYFRGRDYYPFKRLADVLQAFERNMNDNSRAALLNGVALEFALISSTVWDTIARRSTVRFTSGAVPATVRYVSNRGGHLRERIGHRSRAHLGVRCR